MGFHEDDRIRNKNRVYQQAQEMIDAMKFAKATKAEMIALCHALMADPTNNRNEIYSTVLRIVGGSCEESD